MMEEFQPTWDLETIFPGGSQSKDFQAYLKTVEEQIESLKKSVEVLEVTEGKVNVEKLARLIESLEKTMKKLREISAFVSCLSAQDVTDEVATMLVGKRSELHAQFSSIQTILDEKITQIDEGEWQEILKSPSFKKIAFVLEESRAQAKEKLPMEQEMLLNDLAVNGYQGWGQMYDAIVGKNKSNIRYE